MALRYGRRTRFTRDFDAARIQSLEEPKQVPIARSDHQVARKLHAVSEERSERARDLVDLQLPDEGEGLDLAQVAATFVWLFDYHRQQAWPPTTKVGDSWDTLYTEATDGIDVLPTVEDVVEWATAVIERITAAAP